MRKFIVLLFVAARAGFAQTAADEVGADIIALDGSAAAVHVCARYSDGSVVCWGTNASGQLGQRDRFTRTLLSARGYRRLDVTRGRSVIQTSLGADFTCARLDDNTVRCFGSNAYNQLGRTMVSSYGGDPGQMGNDLVAADLGVGRIAFDIASGRAHTCAALDTGAVACWGQNTSGQLGYTGTLPAGTSPTALNLSRAAKGVAVGDGFSCALLVDNTVTCWGQGLATPGVPFAIPFGRTVRWLAAGGTMACLMLDDGRVACGTPGGFDAAFVPLPNGRTAVAVNVGARGTCVSLGSGVVQCQDTLGALLNLTTYTMIDAGAGHVIVEVAATANAVCFAREDGTAGCVAR